MFHGELIRFAITNHTATILILALFYFIMRDKLDKRYVSKEVNNVDEEKRDQALRSIHIEIRNMRVDMDKKIDLLIDLINSKSRRN